VPNVPVNVNPTAPERDFQRDEHSLLSLPEQRRSRQSFQGLRSPSGDTSLIVEISSSGDRSGSDTVPVPAKLLKKHKERAYSPEDFDDNDDDNEIEPEKADNMPFSEPKPEIPFPVGIMDAESGNGLRRTASKVSLPMRPNEAADQNQRNSSASDSAIEWGPMHPCYPHLNPHVPTKSPLYSSTRIIRIPRDWMTAGDLAPTFANVYPEVLDGIVSEDQFRQLLRHVNEEIVDVFNPFSVRNWADSILGLVTLWIWDDLGLTGIKKRLNGLEKWIERWNKEIGAEEGVQIIPLRRTAYMSVGYFQHKYAYQLHEINWGTA
jgi:hypothetical protein